MTQERRTTPGGGISNVYSAAQGSGMYTLDVSGESSFPIPPARMIAWKTILAREMLFSPLQLLPPRFLRALCSAVRFVYYSMRMYRRSNVVICVHHLHVLVEGGLLHL